MKRTLCFRSGLLALGLALPVLLLAKEPMYDGLGSYSRKVTTQSDEAARYFNQGLAFLYGFNHGAAIRSFQEAARLDPQCAMAHWGIALANGPHINVPFMPPPAVQQAWDEISLAKKYSDHATPVERDLITALATRYANPQPEDRSPLDRAYADAMRKVWQAHPDDPDVGVLFAESLMDLRPWGQWTHDGQPQPETPEILATLEAVMKLNLNHPFANHLYIHALEASPHPERAIAAADRLRDLQPGLAHNVHMPSHIDIRTGNWHQAIVANRKAIAAAQRYRAVAGPAQGPLLIYNAHNHHMLAYAAMMTGQSKLAVDEIHTMVSELPEPFLKEFAPFVDAYVAMPYEVLLRFGKWDDVLAAPEHPDYLPFSRAMRHAARAIAFAAKSQVDSAREEQHAFAAAAKLVPDTEEAGPVKVSAILAVVTPMVDGEILFRDGNKNQGIARLRDAVVAEDALNYIEPPAWFLPVRHSLGAALMQAGRYDEAEHVYREDLQRLPGNGWSTFGLAESLRVRGKADDAAKYDAEFSTIWRDADVKITSSCMCQPGVQVATASAEL